VGRRTVSRWHDTRAAAPPDRPERRTIGAVGDILLILVVILAVVLVWRGPKTLPKLGQALGRGVREARREASTARDDIARRVDGEPSAEDGDER
jgi:mttA/Hcf106 family protein